MAVIISTLSPAADQGTPQNGGARYTTLATWENAQQGNLTTTANVAGEPSTSILECYAGIYVTNTQVSLAGWTTNATYNITIKPASGSEHGGVYGAGVKFTSSTNYAHILNMTDANMAGTIIEGVEFYHSGTFQACCIYKYQNSLVTIKKCLFSAANTTASFGAYFTGPNVSNIYNCKFTAIGSATSAIYFRDYDSSSAYNCLAIGFEVGFNRAGTNGTSTVKNNVAVSSTISDFNGTRLAGSNNASQDGTASSLSIGTVTGVSTSDGVDFVAPSAGDYTPTSTGKLADPAGTDLSTFFDDDITGTPR